VSCFCELAAAEAVLVCCAVDAAGAPGADDSCLTAILTGVTGDGANTARSVLWILVGRVGVEVENGAADAEQDAMAAGWKRIAKALAGRSPLDTSMVAVRESGDGGLWDVECAQGKFRVRMESLAWLGEIVSRWCG